MGLRVYYALDLYTREGYMSQQLIRLPLLGEDESALSHNYFPRWGITMAQLEKILFLAPNFMAPIFGGVAELKLEDEIKANPLISELWKINDRSSDRGDRLVKYNGEYISIESKSIEGGDRLVNLGGGRWRCSIKVSGTEDSREVQFSDRSVNKTKHQLRGEFDILAINCFVINDTWRFVYILNSDLPKYKFKKTKDQPTNPYTPLQMEELVPQCFRVTWPMPEPYTTDLDEILDRAFRQKQARQS